MTSTIHRTWLKRITTNDFTAAWCRQWAAAVVPLSRGDGPAGRRTNLTANEAAMLVMRMNDKGGVLLDAESERVGREWLVQYGHKTLGIPTEAIEKFDHFRFDGNARITYWETPDRKTHLLHPQHAFPVWVMVLTDGSEIDYHREPWQAQTGSPGSWRYTKKVISA